MLSEILSSDVSSSCQNAVNTVSYITINSKIMPFYDFMPNFNTLCIKACMGLGKTNTLYDFIKYNMDKSILIVSFRVTLEEKYSYDLPSFHIYNKIKGNLDVSLYPHLIIQIDSLYRIRGNYDIIIFDEIVYTMSHLVTSCRTREMVYECLTQLLESDNKMIFLDAFINNEIVDWISTFSNRRIKFIENKYTIHDNKKIISYRHDINNFIKELKLTLKKKQRIVIASNNKKELLNIERIINKHFPYLKKLFITKESIEKYNIELWKDMDIVAYTPTITAGISFIDIRYDKVFGLFCNSSSPADMSIQQLFRVRNISTNEYHICVKISGKKDYPIDDEGIEKYIIDNEKCLVSGVKNIKLDYINNCIKKDKYFYLYKIIQKKIFKSNNDYMGYMLELLKEQGINDITFNCNFNKEETKIYNKEYLKYKKEMIDLECEEIVKKPLITEEDAKEMRNNYNKSNNEILTLKKHDFLGLTHISNEVLNKDIYKKYRNHTSQLYHVGYCYAYKDELFTMINKRLNIYIKNSQNEKTITRLHRNKNLEKRIYAIDIISMFGFENIFDKKEIELDKNSIINYIKINKDNLEKLFRTNTYDWENIIKNDEKYFTKIMRYLNDRINSIFKVRIVKNKKSNKYYIKGLNFWDDNSVTYKNKKLIEHIKEKDNEFFQNDEFNDLINNIFEDNKKEKNDNNINNNEKYVYYEELNKTCIKCGKEETINNNIYCIKCKYMNKLTNKLN